MKKKNYLKQIEKIYYGGYDGSISKRIQDLENMMDSSFGKEFPQYFFLITNDQIVGYIFFNDPNNTNNSWIITHNADELSNNLSKIIFKFISEYLITNGYLKLYEIIKSDLEEFDL